jgi:hypothetical protein
MATISIDSAEYSADQSFFTKFAIFLGALIVFGFAQFSMRGFVNFGAIPLWVHFHGIAMLAWIGLFISQNRLAEQGNLALHRKLGRIAAFLVVAIVGLGSFAGVKAIELHRVPPFFTDAYFLGLTQIGIVVFGGLVFAGLTQRYNTEAHRRLMLASTIAITEPSFGRLLPMPLMGDWGEWVILAIQLLMLTVLARHDRKTLGGIHPATASAMAVITLAHVLITFASQNEGVITIAQRLANS